MNYKSRLKKLEASQQTSDQTTVERLAFVIEHPVDTARAIGAAAVARIVELLQIAQARKAGSQ